MNKFIGVGRNTKDGELRTSDNDIQIYTNTLAMTNNFKNKDGNYDSEFINYVAYRKTAEYLKKYSKKGTLVGIDGRIQTRTYEKQDGSKGYITEIVVENAYVLIKDNKEEEPKVVNEFDPLKTKTEYQETDIPISDNDLPF